MSKKITRVSLFCILLWSLSNITKAEARVYPSPFIDTLLFAQAKISSIYHVYDSLPFLTFDLKYKYQSQSSVDSSSETLNGTYTMAGKKAKYNIGNIEFMQNDSFFVTVYNDDQYMLIADPPHANTGKALPMRESMDSLLSSYSSHYNISLGMSSGVGSITFNKKSGDSIAGFNSFRLNYDSTYNTLKSIGYIFDETLIEDDSVIVRHNDFRIEFSNYRFDNISENVYDEGNYIFFEDGIFKPLGKYKDYQLYHSRSVADTVVLPNQ